MEAVWELVLSAIIDARLSLSKYLKVIFSPPGCLQHDVTPGMVIGVFTHDRRIKNVNYKSTLVSVCIQKEAVRKPDA